MSDEFPRVSRILWDHSGRQIGEERDFFYFIGGGLCLKGWGEKTIRPRKPNSVLDFADFHELYYFKRLDADAGGEGAAAVEGSRIESGGTGIFYPAISIHSSCIDVNKSVLFPLGDHMKGKGDVGKVMIIFRQPGLLAEREARRFYDRLAGLCLPMVKIVAPIINAIIGPWKRPEYLQGSEIALVFKSVASTTGKKLDNFLILSDGSLHSTLLTFRSHRSVERSTPGLLLQYQLSPSKLLAIPGNNQEYPLTGRGAGMIVDGGKAVHTAVQFGTHDSSQLESHIMKLLQGGLNGDQLEKYGRALATVHDGREFCSPMNSKTGKTPDTRCKDCRARQPKAADANRLHGNPLCFHTASDFCVKVCILYDLQDKAAKFFFADLALSLRLPDRIFVNDIMEKFEKESFMRRLKFLASSTCRLRKAMYRSQRSPEKQRSDTERNTAARKRQRAFNNQTNALAIEAGQTQQNLLPSDAFDIGDTATVSVHSHPLCHRQEQVLFLAVENGDSDVTMTVQDSAVPSGQEPASEPPAFDPLASEPPAFDPLATEPPAFDPLASEPPAFDPLASESLSLVPWTATGVGQTQQSLRRPDAIESLWEEEF